MTQLTSHAVIDEYLELMHHQREAIFERLADVPDAQLWQRPHPKKWSPGEHLDHTRVLNRCFRRLMQGLWPLLWPTATLLKKRPYPTTIDNVYARPNMPSRVGVLWPPYYRPERPTSLATLHRVLAEEHKRIARFYRGKDEQRLGNAFVWDPPIGRLNFIQALRVSVHHDQHHYRAVARTLQV